MSLKRGVAPEFYRVSEIKAASMVITNCLYQSDTRTAATTAAIFSIAESANLGYWYLYKIQNLL